MRKTLLFVCLISLTHNLNSQYVLYWSDEFDGSTLDNTKWLPETGAGGWGNNEAQYYSTSSDNLNVSAGMLNIIAKQQQIGNAQYTSARIITKGLFDVKYGKVEARIKLPVGQGLWPAFWMLGSNISSLGWPRCGEIDIMEHVSNDPEIHGTYHYANFNNNHVYIGDGTTCNVEEFHIYGVEWTSTSIKWFLDGIQFFQANIQNGANSTEEFHLPFFLLLNMAVGGDWPGYPNGTTVFPAQMQVDYVRVYIDQMYVGMDEISSSEQVKFGPNPTQNEFNIRFSTTETKTIQVKVFALNGVEISNEIVECKGDLVLNTEKLAAGSYVVELSDHQKLLERIKMVKED